MRAYDMTGDFASEISHRKPKIYTAYVQYWLRDGVPGNCGPRADEVKVAAMSQTEAFAKIAHAYKTVGNGDEPEIWIQRGTDNVETIKSGDKELGSLMEYDPRYLMLVLDVAAGMPEVSEKWHEIMDKVYGVSI